MGGLSKASMNTNLFFWNVRGRNDQDKHQSFVNWLNTTKPILGALLETRIKEPFLNQIMSKTCSGWNFTSNHLSDVGGRIVLIWKSPVSVKVLHQSRQSLTCEVFIQNQRPFIFTAVYTSNLTKERELLWK